MVSELKTSREVAEYYANDPWLDNYMIREERREELFTCFGFTPDLDICCEPWGTNSLCPYFYSPRENSLKQSLGGQRILCNPPFQEHTLDWFTRKLERTMTLYGDRTQVMLVMPLKSNESFEAFVQRNRWSLVCVVTKGVSLFDKPSAKSPYINEKAKEKETWQFILCLGFDPDPNGSRMTLRD